MSHLELALYGTCGLLILDAIVDWYLGMRTTRKCPALPPCSCSSNPKDAS